MKDGMRKAVTMTPLSRPMTAPVAIAASTPNAGWPLW